MASIEAWREPDEYNVFVAKTRAKELDEPTQANSRPEAAMPSGDLQHPGQQPSETVQRNQS
ncbi:hypothetical protein [Propionimicrobium lymphophilum]|uniref:hypothetical protein n=1 Tax=Propionimicrobium lymphophilum TaxID=33012 RepID=UPI0023F5623F|nr:hypothetical protein [Propionimicrobium lymphophilum]